MPGSLTSWMLILILGWCLGALVNYLADILPIQRRIVVPVCMSCGCRQPLINYFVFPRTCPACQYRRSKRTWFVELISMLCVAQLWYRPAPRLGLVISLLLFSYFFLIVTIDIEHRLILHSVSLFGVAFGFFIGVWSHGFQMTLIGGIAGFVFMLGLYYLGKYFARGMSRWRGESVDEEALGFGDVNLSGILGLILGWPGILAGLVLAILIGGVVSLLYLSVMLVSRRYRLFSAIPYGPFLIAAAVYLLYLRDLF